MFLVLVAIALATPCSTLLVQRFLLNALCWRYYCSKLSLVQHYCCYFCYSLFNATTPLDVPCLTLLFLLLLVQRHCFSYYLTLLLLLLFFIWHYCSSCLTLLQFCSFILNTICLNTYLLHYDVVLCSLFDIVVLALCFKLVFSPLVFSSVGGAIQIQVVQARLGKWDFFFQSLFIDDFFNYPCFWEILVDNVFICCV